MLACWIISFAIGEVSFLDLLVFPLSSQCMAKPTIKAPWARALSTARTCQASCSWDARWGVDYCRCLGAQNITIGNEIVTVSADADIIAQFIRLAVTSVILLRVCGNSVPLRAKYVVLLDHAQDAENYRFQKVIWIRDGSAKQYVIVLKINSPTKLGVNVIFWRRLQFKKGPSLYCNCSLMPPELETATVIVDGDEWVL